MKFPKESIVKANLGSCLCNVPHKVSLIGNYETRICPKCTTIKGTKQLNKADYEAALKDIFL